MIKTLYSKIKDSFSTMGIRMLLSPFFLFYYAFIDTSRYQKKALKKVRRIAKKRGWSNDQLHDAEMKIISAGSENDVFKDAGKINPYKNHEESFGQVLACVLSSAEDISTRKDNKKNTECSSKTENLT